MFIFQTQNLRVSVMLRSNTDAAEAGIFPLSIARLIVAIVAGEYGDLSSVSDLINGYGKKLLTSTGDESLLPNAENNDDHPLA
jgi:hypothetical protein